jgi:hypothetical protein
VAVAEADGSVAETLPADDGDVAEEEYADPNTGSDEAGEEAGDARPEDLGEEE